jgi:hypothetical protein
MLSSAGSTARGRHMLQTFGRDGNDSSVGLPAERRKAIKAIEAISYQSYILINEMPKIDNLKRLFPHAYRQAPVLTTAR